MRVEEFDYPLPRERIAQVPSRRRGESRLLVLHRKDGTMEHRRFGEIIEFLGRKDALVVNDTRVFPARLFGRKETGGRVEILLVQPLDPAGGSIPPLLEGTKKDLSHWECLLKGLGQWRPGTVLQLNGDGRAEVLSSPRGGRAILRFEGGGGILDLLERIGKTPLPPYIDRRVTERKEFFHRRRYQTVFARRTGSIAAPTAGLHFSRSLLRALEEKGVEIHSITLQVGIGTFTPVKVERVEEHRMEREYREISPRTADALNRIKASGGRICAVGTTTVRALESAVDSDGRIAAERGYTDLFLYPGCAFRVVDLLVTNFHLPRSTLMMLVCAFAGMERAKRAYEEAIEKGYGFYSYGDAMLIL